MMMWFSQWGWQNGRDSAYGRSERRLTPYLPTGQTDGPFLQLKDQEGAMAACSG